MKSYQSGPASPAQLAGQITKAPVAVGISMGDVLMMYTSGIVTSEKCGTQVNHTVLAVGYGTSSDGTDFFILKNTWG